MLSAPVTIAAPASPVQASGRPSSAPLQDVFVEFSRGAASLGAEALAAGWHLIRRASLGSESALDKLYNELDSLRTDGHRIVIHLEPPIRTFARSRDRSSRTRLRSRARPGGFHPGSDSATSRENTVARRMHDFAAKAARDLQAAVSLSAPAASYLWMYLDDGSGADSKYTDTVLSTCRYGSSTRRNVQLRCWNMSAVTLRARCLRRHGQWTCGLRDLKGHSEPTLQDRYPDLLRQTWVAAYRDALAVMATPESARADVAFASEGRVKRHRARGSEQESAREKKAREDYTSNAGMRNPAEVLKRWPEMATAVAPVLAALRSARSENERLRGLVRCCGKEPRRQPPSEAAVAAARTLVEQALGLPSGSAERHHEASTWRYELVREVQRRAGDPDIHVAKWLKDGAPMGLSAPIQPGGLFPRQSSEPETSLQDLEVAAVRGGNHPSFLEPHGLGTAPGLTLVQEHVDDGFGLLLRDRQHAEKMCGARVFPAPLGNITKPKEDGTLKHRLIQDLRRNGVNASVELPERQVLPRPIDHAKALAKLARSSREGEGISILVLDFRNAFMSIPLASTERRFNCAEVPEGLIRRRPKLDEEEVDEGTFVLWRVLGFGGRPNPLVYSRAASFAMRTAQALLGLPTKGDQKKGLARVTGQLFVDDPIWSLVGTLAEREEAADVILLWWLCLGIPLAWNKGVWADDTSEHQWIGVRFQPDRSGTTCMRLPPDFLKLFLENVKQFTQPSASTVSLQDADKMVGRAGRIAHIVPEARPFATALWAALAAARRADRGTVREAPPGRVAVRRFRVAAKWMQALASGTKDAPFDLQRTISADGPEKWAKSEWYMECDASPWGGGAILRYQNSVSEWFAVEWREKDASHLDISPGLPKDQTFWEMAILMLGLIQWGDWFTALELRCIGDNTGALGNILALKGRGPLLAISREIAWRQAQRRWRFSVGHLPTEFNRVADALSRLAAPGKTAKRMPAAVSGARRVHPPCLADLWALR